MMLPRFFRGRDDSDSSPSTPSPQPPTVLSHHPPSSSSAAGPARPIRFVYCDEKGKFVMDPEALATLQLVKEPIGVFSVCGRALQGKSFILNQIQMDSEAAKTARESLELVFHMSNLLDTGLDRHTLSVLISRCDLGLNPEALAAVVKELHTEPSLSSRTKYWHHKL